MEDIAKKLTSDYIPNGFTMACDGGQDKTSNRHNVVDDTTNINALTNLHLALTGDEAVATRKPSGSEQFGFGDESFKDREHFDSECDMRVQKSLPSQFDSKDDTYEGQESCSERFDLEDDVDDVQASRSELVDSSVQGSEPHVVDVVPNSLRLNIITDGLPIEPSVGHLSPLTPTSKFHKLHVLTSEPSTLITAAVLCNWDNIFGPKVRCLWFTEHEKHSELTLDLLNFVANQTLGGEIMHDPLDPALELKLYILAERGILLAALVFGAEGKRDMAVHSLSIVVPHDKLKEFFVWKDICLEWMQRAVRYIRIELTKNVDAAYESFQRSFSTFIRTIESAKRAGFPKKVELFDTVLHPHHVFDAEFVRKAIAAHLMQCQQSLVIGHSVKHINLMINTLLLFVSQHKRHRCRPFLGDSSDVYSPEFCLQGCLKNEVLDDVTRNIYHSCYPTALIDVSRDKVWILCAPNEYAHRRHQFIVQDLRNLMYDLPEDKPKKISSVFERMSYDDSVVDGFLKELHGLPLTHGVREAYVRHFTSSIQRTGLTLIQLTEAEMKKSSSVNAITFLPKLRQMLSLTYFCDLMIVMCAAELLKPGIMRLICADETKLDRLILPCP